jgi:membrane fusion protein, multidrug efflux system
MRSRLDTFLIVSAIMLMLFSVTACGRKGTPKAAKPPEVTVVEPTAKQVTKFLEYTGNTAPLESVEIRARVMGFLQKICFEPRARVKAGQLLFVIDPRQYQATAKEAAAKLEAQKAQSKLAQTELQIAQQLETKEAISALKLEKEARARDVAKADVDLADANLENANLNVEWTQVTSPIKGRVSRNMVDVGNLVGATEKTLLTTVVNDESVYAYFNISELDMLTVRRKAANNTDPTTEMPKNWPVFVGLADEEGYPHEGRMDFADTKVDSSTGTIQVRAIFPNPDHMLLGGMFVRVRIPVENRQALLVPAVAVQFDQGGRYVLTVDDKNIVQQKRIQMGDAVDEMRVIEKGITPKDRVIVSGILRARPGFPVTPSAATASPSDNAAKNTNNK